jgi:hypothetical protein
MTLYCPGTNCVASNVAVTWVMPFDVAPLVSEAVPKVVPPGQQPAGLLGQRFGANHLSSS